MDKGQITKRAPSSLNVSAPTMDILSLARAVKSSLAAPGTEAGNLSIKFWIL
jgi:hypothetical protein